MVAAITDFVSDEELESALEQSVDDDGVLMRVALAAAIADVEDIIGGAILDTTEVIHDTADYRPQHESWVICIQRMFVSSARIFLDDDQRVNIADVQAVTSPGGNQAHVVSDGDLTLIRPPVGGWPTALIRSDGDFRIELTVGATDAQLDARWKITALRLAEAHYNASGVQQARDAAHEVLAPFQTYVAA